MPSRPPRLAAGLLALALLGLAGPAPAFTVKGLAVEDAAVRRAVEEPTLVRELDSVRFVGTTRATEWLLDRPDIAAPLARRLHPPLEPYRVGPLDNGRYPVSDGGSLSGTFRLMANGHDRRLYLCRGRFRFQEQGFHLAGDLVVLLVYRELPAADPEPLMEAAPTLYVRLESGFAHGLVKLLGPFLSGVVDRRVANLAAATQLVSRRVTRDPAGLYAEMIAWEELRPEQREAFRRAFLPVPAAR